MKLRYQMRGLGVGIIVTALLMGVAEGGRLPLSDAEIRARALELGMVDSNSLKLTDISGSGVGSVPESDAGTVSGNTLPEGPEIPETSGDTLPEGDEAPETSGDTLPEDSEAPGTSGDTLPEDSEALGASGDTLPEGEEATEVSGPADVGLPEESKVTIVIEAGASSQQICELLVEAGLVEDAYSLDRYLCANGYSTQIRYGSYEISLGVSQEEIIRIITGGR